MYKDQVERIQKAVGESNFTERGLKKYLATEFVCAIVDIATSLERIARKMEKE